MVGFCLPLYSGLTCSLIYILMIGIFFLAAILRKQINDNMSMSFSMIGGTIGGIVLLIVGLYIPFWGSLRIGFVLALIGLAGGGFLGGLLGLPDALSSD